MTSLEGAACVFRPYEDRDLDEVRRFRCRAAGQNFTRDPERVIRQAPEFQRLNPGDQLFIAVADMPGEGIVGVVVYHALRLGSISSNLRPYIAALGVRLEFRRRGIATRLKESAMLDMAEHGLEGPTVSLVNRRNVAMQQLNATRFHAVVDRYPDDEKYDLVTVAIELED